MVASAKSAKKQRSGNAEYRPDEFDEPGRPEMQIHLRNLHHRQVHRKLIDNLINIVPFTRIRNINLSQRELTKKDKGSWPHLLSSYYDLP